MTKLIHESLSFIRISSYSLFSEIIKFNKLI
uniref:Uncharacterized protein n=1 Tax=Rhizophora mucronata TaxID=61149 RepID=A0A2P2QV31_RHIMU